MDECETDAARTRIESSLSRLLHRTVSIRFERSTEEEPPPVISPSSIAARRDDLAGDPMIQKVVELFEARPLHLEYEEESPHSPSS